MQELRMIDFETNPPPNDGDICLVELYSYSELVDTKKDAEKRRFMTLTWKSGGEPMPYPGRFINKDGDIVAVFKCRWMLSNQIKVLIKKTK